jgi:hypothetical protein
MFELNLLNSVLFFSGCLVGSTFCFCCNNLCKSDLDIDENDSEMQDIIDRVRIANSRQHIELDEPVQAEVMIRPSAPDYISADASYAAGEELGHHVIQVDASHH